MAISILYNPMPTRLFEPDGDFAAGAKAYFYLARTTTPLVVYTDSPLAVPLPWPVVADAFGLLPPIYIAKGEEYKVRIEDALGSLLYAADGIANPADPESGGGGGGGVVVTTPQIFQTGDMLWNASSADRIGWVKCNGRTISPATGTGDTANADCQALFTHLWNTFPNTICAVTPSRGANAAADWAAAKSIATLDMRGYGIAGLDDMGAVISEAIQIVGGAIDTTNASATVVCGFTELIARGMYVIADGIPAGTYVTYSSGAGAGVWLELSAAATATAIGTTARFSFFTDAQVPGAAGGGNSLIQTVEELALHAHDTVQLWGTGTPNNADLTGTPSVRLEIKQGTMTSGLSSPMNIWTPTRLGSWYCKK